MESVTHGDLDGDQKEEAAVVLNHSGGTANWDYLYVYKLERNVPRLLGWLENRSRAECGLVLVRIIHSHELQLDFADYEGRAGDWCSERFIRARYNWRDGQFLETGTREKSDLKNTHSPIRVPALL